MADISHIMTFGDVRKSIIDDIAKIRSGELEQGRGQVLVGLYKELNSNIQTEINATKLALQTEEKAHNFGKVMGMGRRLITNGDSA